MKSSWNIFLTFLIAGMASGIGSGLSVALPPLGLFLPGILFGFSISYAIHKSLTALTSPAMLALTTASTVAWFIAIVASLLSMRIPGFDNGYFGGGRSGAFGGGAGAFVFALALVIAVEDLKPLSSLVTITVAGAIFGSLFSIVGIFISDHTAMGHPFDDFLSFPIWQAGVASTIPLFRRRPAATTAVAVP